MNEQAHEYKTAGCICSIMITYVSIHPSIHPTTIYSSNYWMLFDSHYIKIKRSSDIKLNILSTEKLQSTQEKCTLFLTLLTGLRISKTLMYSLPTFSDSFPNLLTAN